MIEAFQAQAFSSRTMMAVALRKVDKGLMVELLAIALIVDRPIERDIGGDAVLLAGKGVLATGVLAAVVTFTCVCSSTAWAALAIGFNWRLPLPP